MVVPKHIPQKPHARAADLATVRRQWGKRRLPHNLKGKTLLDVGCWAGGYCVVAKEHGAERAIGVDICRSPSLFKGVEFRQLDFMSDTAYQLPQVDIVLLMGVIYHTHDPVGMLMRAQRLARECVYIETAFVKDAKEPVLEMFDDHTNWFCPSKAGLKRMMTRVGLEPTWTNPLDERRLMACGTVVEAPEHLPRGKVWMDL